MHQRLALYTFGQFRLPSEHPANDGFHALNDPTFAAAEAAEGFIARSGYEDEPGPACWGEQVYPRFYRDRGDGWAPATLSLWRDAESVTAYVYSGLHSEAMRHAREWFDKPAWPPLVLWWVAADHSPDWAEAVARHEHLADHGPTPRAFTLKMLFDATGRPATTDRDRIRNLIAHNSAAKTKKPA
ncbi:uncharacterized protein DUF3291 [Breoghania corrubedonensis]|uniref:Uncharacterized protein DUF3291 n=1 Tax=Breoghania corrubedonensis TaxID=665038 RepID=A0A2T5V8E7_9HYPH|nr:DUF3291 domain-containing protein [Breoghania corrubedonensis]PTW60023.1 uncharacterized protein DUF3291 [Breoghania corrubedonensis]